MSLEAKLRLVIAKKEAIFSHIISLYNTAKKIVPSVKETRNKLEFLAVSSNIDKLYSDFNILCDQHNELELEKNPDYKFNFDNWTSFESLFSFIKQTRTECLEFRRAAGDTSSADINKASTAHPSYFRLAPLELISFSGDSESWPLFYQCFKTNVHENKNLTDGQRVQYLVGKLSGTALNVFAGIIPNESNYATIWNSLVSKYQDKKLLGSMYLNNILDIKSTSDSAAQLNNFIERVHSSWSALKQLGIDDLADFIFTHIASRKIDTQLIQRFELSVLDKEIPTSTDLVNFMRHHVKVLERTSAVHKSTSLPHAQGSFANRSRNNSAPKVSHTFAVTENNVTKPACVFCKTLHHFQLYECTAFKQLPVNERFHFIKSNKCCINCLSSRHSSLSKCASRSTCKQCNKQHHTLLHFDSSSSSAPRTSPHAARLPPPAPVHPAPACSSAGSAAATTVAHKSTTQQSVSPQSLCMHTNNIDHNIPVACYDDVPCTTLANSQPVAFHAYNKVQYDKTVILPTAQVDVSNNGMQYTIRCLVDSASQNHLITLSCCEKLKLKICPLINSCIKTVGLISAPIRGYVSLLIKSRVSDASYKVTLLVVDHITDHLPTRSIQASVMEHFINLPLADDQWGSPGNIDAILGAQLFPFILLGGKIIPSIAQSSQASHSAPYALETTLGYIIMGETSTSCSDGEAWSFGPLVNELNDKIVKFWELEEVESHAVESPEDNECEQLYASTVTRSSCGRYIVSLPFKGDPKTLGNSFITAQRRFNALERKFKSLPTLRQAYNDVINDYIQKGYLSELPYSAATVTEGYFIPHHAVVRPDKSTTKTRVVLDASAKTETGPSLNDLLHTGPNLQADLFSLMLNFRYFKIAITADIQQMYLRILLSEGDRKYQKIVYRFNETEPLRIFQFNSVAFGLRSSPFLAMRTVRQLAEDEHARLPLAAAVATSELYMDDLTTSVPSTADGIQLADQLLALFEAGGFNLVKWASNSPELLAHLPESHRAPIEFTDDSDTLKVLGIKWTPTTDAFSFTTSAASVACTKRAILSTIARLFDVLGFAAPVILYAKLLLQELWLAKVGWDEEPPADLKERFVKFKTELPLLSKLQIPRHLGTATGCTLNLLAFGDSSMKAYGCVIYLHVTYPNRDISVRLVCSKSKVAPLKTVTLARLELCAALLLAKLTKRVYTAFHGRYPIQNIFAFSDSTVALSWIHASPHRWQTFVANRVSKIQELLSPDRFFHINGNENPSDCVSRGLLPSQLVNHQLWWCGPHWIHSPIDEWPIVPFEPSRVEAIPEMKPSVTLTAISDVEVSPLLELAVRVSTWKKLLRITVYVLRFARKLPRSASIQASDLQAAENLILHELQIKYFAEEIKALAKGNLPSPALRKLDPFVDSHGLLRVGGRLTNANIPYENRHPILLPRRDHVVELIIDDCHRSNCHTGSHLLMSLLRQRYWIISARNLIRQRIRKCNFCFKVAPTHPTPMMASLPPARVQEAKAFTHTGVDYAGPLNITLTRRRGVKSQKAYICLFVCLTTKAIHIEIASDLSTDTFIDALKRFLARRGPVSCLYSDNATNFIGAKRQLDELHTFLAAKDTSNAFQAALNGHRITWRTIPARAPHWGGIWEANIKSVKSLLYRTIGQQLLCYEELLTVLTQIECLLNSRPLCVLSEQPHTILTPAHFLNTTPLQSLPAYEVDHTTSLCNRKKLLDRLVQSYWKRWHVDYLHTLQLRQKWNTPGVSIEPGTLVLIHQDDTPPLRWPTGIIEQIYPGKDGVTRMALVRSTTGTFKRPVVKLCPLPSQ